MSDEATRKRSHAHSKSWNQTLPVTSENLERARRVLLYTWDPARLLESDQQPQEIHGILQEGRRDDQAHRGSLGLTLPIAPERTRSDQRAALHLEPSPLLTLNNPKPTCRPIKVGMTKLIEAAYALLSAVLVPDEESSDQPPS